MLTLDLPVEPYWLDLPRGVRVEIRPVTTAVMAAAQAGKIDAAALQSFQGDMTKAMSEAAEMKDWAAVCTVLDDARKKGGF